jgi:hypothetical protein
VVIVMAINIYDYYITFEDYARAEEYGVSRSLLCERIRRLCWDKERAITTPPKPKRSKIPQEIRDLAEQNGIPFPLLSQRIRNGWDCVRAATTPKMNVQEARRANLAKNKNNDPYLQMALKNGIRRDTYYFRVKKAGWPPWEAATRPVMSKAEIARMVNSRSDHPWSLDNQVVFR